MSLLQLVNRYPVYKVWKSPSFSHFILVPFPSSSSSSSSPVQDTTLSRWPRFSTRGGQIKKETKIFGSWWQRCGDPAPLSLSLSLPSLYVCACIIPRKLLALPSSVCANQSVFPLAGAVSYGCTEWNNEPLWTKGQNKRRIPFSSCIGFWLSWIIHKLTALSLSLYISLSFWFISQPHNSLIYAPVGGFSSKAFC